MTAPTVEALACSGSHRYPREEWRGPAPFYHRMGSCMDCGATCSLTRRGTCCEHRPKVAREVKR